jgi:curved DNA-binding protein CbpA
MDGNCNIDASWGMAVEGKRMKKNAPPQTYSPEQVEAYQADLEELLEDIESADTHYQVLGLDALATTGEVKLAYMRQSALLNPSYYNLELPQPEQLLPTIDKAFDKVSQAFSVLVNFKRRSEYDDSLFQRAEHSADDKTIEESSEELRKRERRRHQRFELSVPIRVSGYDRKGGKWNEMTHSIDASLAGAGMKLSMPVRKGMILKLSMPMPMTLRSHGFFDNAYDVYAIVRRIRHEDERVSFVGVEFVGEQPPEAYFAEPWGVFETETEDREERRKVPRKKRNKLVNIDYFNEDQMLILQGQGVTEDLSKVGMRVCVEAPPKDFYMVKVFSNKGKFENLALVSNRYAGEDGLERLCLTFVEPS